MNLIENARRFAEQAHADQRRKGALGEPYITHVAEVAEAVRHFGGPPEAVAAAWLHDTVEDCGVSLQTITKEFGPVVADLVAELTDDKTLHKALRKELQVQTAPHKSDAAALIKICDKLSNVRAVGHNPASHWSLDRKLAYLDWAEAVVLRLPAGADPVRGTFEMALADSRTRTLARSI